MAEITTALTIVETLQTFGAAIEHVRANPNEHAFRLPSWSPEVHIRMQVPDENSKMSAPYLYVSSKHGRVPWIPTMIEILHQGWDTVTVK